MRIDDVHRVLIVGAGTMGLQVGFQCAGHGYHVVLYDNAPQVLDAAMGRLQAYADRLIAGNSLTAGQCQSALARISCSGDPKTAARDVDLISESLPEDPRLKGQVFAQFTKWCPPHTIFTTNTSTLLPSQFARASGRPRRLIALHFHPPVWTSKIADVMPHKRTAPEVTALILEFARRIGQVPIPVHKEKRGYVFNSMYGALNHQALALAANGVSSVEDVDRAWMGILGVPIGPFGLMDVVGLDTLWHILNYWAKRVFFLRQFRRNADFVKGYVDRGHLGTKSGQGFYSYPAPAYERPGFVAAQSEALWQNSAGAETMPATGTHA